MNDTPFRVVLTALLVGFVAHRGYYTRKVQHSAASIDEQPTLGRASRLAEILAPPALVATLLYVVAPTWLAWADLPLPAWLRWSGVGLAASGFALLQWSQLVLDHNWSDAPSLLADHELVTRGPYRWIRHPIYAAFLAILGAILPISANALVGGLWLVISSLDIFSRVKVEEALMNARFGERYRKYARRTGRLFPRIGRPAPS